MAVAPGVACFSEASGGSEASTTGGSTSDTSTSTAIDATSSIESSSADATTVSSEGSSSDGPPILCGNGEVDPGESCDDGNAAQGDGCNIDCRDSGALLWEWQRPDSIDRDAAWAVEVSAEQVISIAGWITDGDDDPRAWVASLDHDGAVRWENDTFLAARGRAYGMTLIPEGMAIVGEVLAPDPAAGGFVAVIDNDGQLLDDAPLQTSAALTIAYDVAHGDGGAVAVGVVDLEGNLDAVSLRFDPEVAQPYAANGTGEDAFRSIARGGRHAWLAGWSAGAGGRVDGLLVRRMGDIEDAAPALANGESNTRIYAVAPDANGRPIVGGSIRDAAVLGPAVLARYNAQGNALEESSMLDFGMPWAVILGVAIAANGDVVVGGAAGATNDDAQLVVTRIAPDLVTERWTRLLGDSAANFVADVAIDPVSEEIVVVGVRAEADAGDIWVAKFTP